MNSIQLVDIVSVHGLAFGSFIFALSECPIAFSVDLLELPTLKNLFGYIFTDEVKTVSIPSTV
jgi:hypothetical protein